MKNRYNKGWDKALYKDFKKIDSTPILDEAKKPRNLQYYFKKFYENCRNRTKR